MTRPRELPSWLGIVLLTIVLSGKVAAAEDGPGECPDNADGLALSVKQILGPQYADPAAGTLGERHRSLEKVLLTAGHCAATVRSVGRGGENRQRDIIEWHSINQWIERLSNFIKLNDSGDQSVDWRAEYALFAEIYEFEP